LRDLGPQAVISPAYVKGIFERLPRKNPYHTNAVELTKTLRLLGLMDDSRVPTSITMGVWGRSTTPARTTGGPLSKPQLQHGPAVIHKTPVAAPMDASAPVRRAAAASFRGKPQSWDIFVGNLDYETTREELDSLFSSYGQVISVKIPSDYVTGRSRGFAFVRMSDRSAATQAMEKLSGQLLRGRPLRVSW
jgi:ATP-dependent DNA helicase RecG